MKPPAVIFRATALEDLRAHDRWRASLEPLAAPLRDEIGAAIVRKISGFPGYTALPYPVIVVRGEVVPIKRCGVTVRSKRFAVYVLAGPDDSIEVARIRHPQQQPL